MVDKKYKDKINEKIDELKQYAHKEIDSNPGATRDIHHDMLDAVEIIRHQMGAISDSEESLPYVGKVLQKLKLAREEYRYAAYDEGGYGIVTFHQVIKVAEDLYSSLGGRDEDLEAIVDTNAAEPLYMANDPWERCFRAFAMQDYIGSAIEAERIVLNKTAPVRREVLLVLLISLQRTYRNGTAEGLARDLMLPANYNEPFLCALIGMMIGAKTPEAVGEMARTDEELCQFNYYHGWLFLMDGNAVDAALAFRACADTEADCDERFLALAELNHANRTPVVSIYQLIQRAKRAEEDSNLEQAKALSSDAFKLAREHIGDDDPVTESLGLRLAFY
jgi:hypothetical protein